MFPRAWEATFGSRTRRMLAAASAEVNARPLAYFASFRRLNTHVFRSVECFQPVARSGSTEPFGAYFVRPLKSSVCTGSWPAKEMVFGSSAGMPAPAIPYERDPLCLQAAACAA
jgi:hypothetical protein